MFVLAAASFTKEITVRVPVDGGFEKQTMMVTYQTLPTDEAEEMLDIKRGNQGMRDFVSAMIVRVDDLVDTDKKPVEWNDAVRDQLIKLPYAMAAIRDGYFEAMTEARTKN